MLYLYFLHLACLAAASSPAPVIDILAKLYMHQYNHINIPVLNLKSLMVVCTPLDWSFISIYFFVLNLGSWFALLSSKTFFFIFHHYCYTDLNSLSYNLLSFFKRYISFFWCLYFSFFIPWIIFWIQFLWRPCDFICTFITN